MFAPSTRTTTRRPAHGTASRRYAHGCHCQRCLTSPAANRLAARVDLGISRLPTPVVDLTVPHGYLRYRDQGCCCDTCTTTHPQSIICCEREAVELEGAGHDWDCPGVAV